jgi:DNA polymerase I-like protein with 3'-5' exonuclease and polymerase domains
MDGITNLFGSEFSLAVPDVKDLTKKAKPQATTIDIQTEKILKSKKLSIHERLGVIRDKVIKILGKQMQNTVVIRTLDDFSAYIDKAIARGIIAIDTETNNSLDPVTCQLMGPCLYVPGEKQAYIPLNHVDVDTGERLPNQLTEEDCRQQFQRLKDNNVFIVMHNGKFDYEVIKTTCGIDLPPNWDTMVAARLIDENELAGLKYQYTTKIDSSQQKYDIEGLFENVQYALVDPELFALYAATDSMMTYKLFEYQWPIMTAEDMARVYWVFMNIEMPIVVVTAEMELRGVSINTKFGKKLKLKYKQLLEELDIEINAELAALQNQILDWKLDPERGGKEAHIYMPKKSVKSQDELEQIYKYIEPDKIPSGKVNRQGEPIMKTNPQAGKRYKLGKKSCDMLSDPINLASPAQLAILFYDILGCDNGSKKAPRGTGEAELEAIAEKRPDLKICKLILKRRGIVKLITTYIDVIPNLVAHWPDGRIRFHLNALGTDTGRYSSGGKLKFFENGEPVVVSGINIQNIPSHNKEIRMLFQGDTKYRTEVSVRDTYIVKDYEEVETSGGWKFAVDLEPLKDYLIIDGQPKLLTVKTMYTNKVIELKVEEVAEWAR